MGWLLGEPTGEAPAEAPPSLDESPDELPDELPDDLIGKSADASAGPWARLVIVAAIPAPLAAFTLFGAAGRLLFDLTLGLGVVTAAVLALGLDHRWRRTTKRARRATERARRATERARRATRTTAAATTLGVTPRGARRTRTRGGSRSSGGTLLRLLDEDRSPGEHLVVPLIDRRVSIGICRDLDKGKPARTLRLTVNGNAHALNGSSRLRERFSQLQLRDGVGQVANKQLSTHLLLLFSLFAQRLSVLALPIRRPSVLLLLISEISANPVRIAVQRGDL